MALPPRPSPQQPSSGRAVTAGTLRPSTLLSGAAVVTAKRSLGLGNSCHLRARARSARLSAPQALWRRVSGGVGAAAIPVAVLAVDRLLAPRPSSCGRRGQGCSCCHRCCLATGRRPRGAARQPRGVLAAAAGSRLPSQPPPGDRATGVIHGIFAAVKPQDAGWGGEGRGER